MAMAIRRRARRGALITLVPMIDVMIILLIFFMVTSSYLNLDMIPAVEPADDPGAAAAPATGPTSTVMIRIAGDGSAGIAGRRFDDVALGAEITRRLAADPGLQILLLPSGEADMQALVRVMDVATRSGAKRVRVVRIEARP